MRGRECREIDSPRGIRKGLSPALGRWAVFARQRREGKAFQEQEKGKWKPGWLVGKTVKWFLKVEGKLGPGGDPRGGCQGRGPMLLSLDFIQ